MAKKKSRSANVARKREKRNRRQKSKQKQIASGKQKKVNYGKLDEEGLFNMLMSSREFCKEPEFENIHFDLELTKIETISFFEEAANHVGMEDEDEDETVAGLIEIVEEEDEELDEEKLFQMMNKIDEFCEKMGTTLIKKLITPEITHSVKNALSNLEKRFRRIGNRQKADTAFVSGAFFDALPPEQHAEHPIFEGVFINTLRVLTEEPTQDDMQIHEIDEHLNVTDAELTSSDVIVEDAEVIESIPTIFESDSDQDTSVPCPEKYPAKALYKNCIGERIIEKLYDIQMTINNNGKKSNENNPILEFDVHLTVSEDRFQIYAQNVDELTIVMEKMEEYFPSALIFLAKTIEEGGNPDGTQ